MRSTTTRRARPVAWMALIAVSVVSVLMAGSTVRSVGAGPVADALSAGSHDGARAEATVLDRDSRAAAPSPGGRAVVGRLLMALAAAAVGLRLVIAVVGSTSAATSREIGWDGSSANRTRGPPLAVGDPTVPLLNHV